MCLEEIILILLIGIIDYYRSCNIPQQSHGTITKLHSTRSCKAEWRLHSMATSILKLSKESAESQQQQHHSSHLGIDS